MSNPKTPQSLDRRDFLKATAAATVAGAAAVGTTSAVAATQPDDGMDYRNYRPDIMNYRKLGRTNFMCSRLVFGGGAALSGGKALNLLERVFEAGINHIDMGSNVYYKGSEKELAPFLKAHRDEVWVTSKAPIRVGRPPRYGEEVSVDFAKRAAEQWGQLLDDSLSDLDIDYVDAYYIMMVAHPGIVRSEEMNNAFLKAKEAGKVGHFGISTHQHAEECLEAAIETGWYDLAMIAVTPAGWYDGISNRLVAGEPNLREMRPLFDRARESGIGLVGMKAARHIAATPRGPKDTTVFDEHYNEQQLAGPLNPFQRAYAYVLENGMDVVNSDMQNFKHFEENLIAARTSQDHFA